MTRTAVYPGSFNPPTIAHLAISKAAKEQRNLQTVVWSVSRTALGKSDLDQSQFSARMAVLEEVAVAFDWIKIQATDLQLLADIANGFEVLILGADKWQQIQEPHWYDYDIAKRDAALENLPELAIAPRPPNEIPSPAALDLSGFEDISSTAARAGNHHHMLPQARASGLWS